MDIVYISNWFIPDYSLFCFLNFPMIASPILHCLSESDDYFHCVRASSNASVTFLRLTYVFVSPFFFTIYFITLTKSIIFCPLLDQLNVIFSCVLFPLDIAIWNQNFTCRTRTWSTYSQKIVFLTPVFTQSLECFSHIDRCFQNSTISCATLVICLNYILNGSVATNMDLKKTHTRNLPKTVPDHFDLLPPKILASNS